jgi:hypothetical protein
MLTGGLLTWHTGMMKGSSDLDLTLKLECEVQKGILHVRYVLTNLAKLPILAYDGAPGLPPDAKWPDLTAQLYVSVLGESVAFKRVNPPIPPGVQVNRVFLPPLSQTLPGESRTVQFQLHEPVAERSQYTPDFSGATYRERPVQQIELHLGYFWQTAGMELTPFPANPKAFRLKGAHAPQLLAVARSYQTLLVKERTDSIFQRT